ncbi:NAD-dependent epimerase/dehydratase family protein [Aquimarina agarilytica]|uniref:NAD-dependent epimerase/dehydratase family protein n=1 Tax=Aquimarina agarilytica TaxID=1087449 RepID=UPI000288D6DA|nr:NAD-dependent epimerase/dehydratase family protein [Aquimarina agarilytica]
MRTLVIGGSGFVGSRLLSQLGDVSKVINFDKNQSPFFKEITVIGDIRNKEQLDAIFNNNDISNVVLLAAEHRDDISPKSLYYDVNVKGTQNVLDAMDQYGVKDLFFTSSVAVYGLNKDNPDETHDIDPFNHYGKSKWEAEKVIKSWYDKDTKDKNITIIRPTVIFGERNRGNVYNLLKQIASGRFVMIGDGLNKKSMAYVGNVVAFIKKAINNNAKGYKVYNYVDNPDLTMNELVSQVHKSLNKKGKSIKMPYSLGMLTGYAFDLISKITNRKYAISSVRVKKFCAKTQFNATKIHSSFTSPFSLQEGLDHTLKYEFASKKDDDVVFYSE